MFSLIILFESLFDVEPLQNNQGPHLKNSKQVKENSKIQVWSNATIQMMNKSFCESKYN